MNILDNSSEQVSLNTSVDTPLVIPVKVIVDSTVNAIGIPLTKLNKSKGRPKHSSNLHSKQPSSIAQRLKKAGIDWVVDFADAIKHNKRERIKLWLRMLPYLITTTNRMKVKKWK